MENSYSIVMKAIEDMRDEWCAKSSPEKQKAIINNEWVEFEVAPSLRSANYAFVPADFYYRLGVLIDNAYASGFTDGARDFMRAGRDLRARNYRLSRGFR